jgi:hypothetical protein
MYLQVLRWARESSKRALEELADLAIVVDALSVHRAKAIAAAVCERLHSYTVEGYEVRVLSVSMHDAGPAYPVPFDAMEEAGSWHRDARHFRPMWGKFATESSTGGRRGRDARGRCPRICGERQQSWRARMACTGYRERWESATSR